MLTRFGGFGYAHVVTGFADRLRRHGLSQTAIDELVINNPRLLFENSSHGSAEAHDQAYPRS